MLPRNNATCLTFTSGRVCNCRVACLLRWVGKELFIDSKNKLLQKSFSCVSLNFSENFYWIEINCISNASCQTLLYIVERTEFCLFKKILPSVLKLKKFTNWQWSIYKFKTKWWSMRWVYNETIKLLVQYFDITLPKVLSNWDLAI